jgi:hypothetical protein
MNDIIDEATGWPVEALKFQDAASAASYLASHQIAGRVEKLVVTRPRRTYWWVIKVG